VRQFKPQHRPKKSSLIIGSKAVLDALSTGEQIERIYISTYGRAAEPILKAAEDRMVPVNKVPVEKINSFNIGEHDGCVALKGKIQYQDLQEVISHVVENGEVPLFLILDSVTDIRNIGGLARTALCCGVHAIIIPEKGVGTLTEDAINASAGALEELSVCRVLSLHNAIDVLHLNGIKVFATEMTAEEKIYDVDFNEPCAIVMGSEDKGIHPSIMKVCDSSFKIPMMGNFESLNVSVAAGMILYEAMKQRSSIK